MRKEYRNAIISGIGGGLGVTIIFYLIRGEVTYWAFLLYPIFFAIAHIIGLSLHKRREEKKD